MGRTTDYFTRPDSGRRAVVESRNCNFFTFTIETSIGVRITSALRAAALLFQRPLISISKIIAPNMPLKKVSNLVLACLSTQLIPFSEKLL